MSEQVPKIHRTCANCVHVRIPVCAAPCWDCADSKDLPDFKKREVDE
jgi:hypothetical protein